MRPEKHRERSYGAAISRGRMFLKARLAWCPGFPVAVQEAGVLWMGMQRREQVVLRREHLHEATYTWSKLTRQYGHVLPQLVDDAESWVEGLPRLLEWLKGAIHRGEALPVSLFEVEHAYSRHAVAQARSLWRRDMALRPLLNALSWLLYLMPKKLPSALSWVEANAQPLKVILRKRAGIEGVMATLALWELASHHKSRRVKPLLCWFASDERFDLSIAEPLWYIKSRLAKKKFTYDFDVSEGYSTIGHELLAFVTWMVTQEQAVARRALELFALLLFEELPSAWLSWWAEVQSLLMQTKGGPSVIETSKMVEQRIANARQELEERVKETPPCPYFQKLFKQIREVAQNKHRALYRQIMPTLKQLPVVQGQILVRAAFLQYWLIRAQWDAQRMIALLPAFRDFLVQYRHQEQILHPWQNILDIWNQRREVTHWCLTHDILDDLSARQKWPIFFQALAKCALEANQPLTDWHGRLIVKLVNVTTDVEQIKHYFVELIQIEPTGASFRVGVLRCAHQLNQGQGVFATLASTLDKAAEADDEFGKKILTVANYFEQASWHRLTRELVLDGEIKRLRTIGPQIATLQALQQNVSPPSRPTMASLPAWCEHYPAEFTESLAILTEMTENAEQLAARILDKQYPNPVKLEEEIAFIEQRLVEQPENHKLAKRLENLRTRLVTPIPVSSARLAKLQAKLQRTTRRAILQRSQEQLDEALHAQLGQLLGIQQMPEWFFDARQLRLLPALLELSTTFRELALRLLRVRCGPPPWNLLDDPANQRFIEQIRQRGINLKPWLNPPAPRLYRGKNGRQVYLEFEHDPLEIFQMGEHFNTCLSIGASNFFSVLANAADINKHVVYARDKQKRVVGRCLLALTKEGYLLTFQPYCHDPKLGLDELMAEIVEELAEKMNTAIVLRGNVPSLVASNWYDDGPTDLCNRFAFLERKSAFRRSLKNMEPSKLLPKLRELFDPLPLNAHTLTLTLELEEFQKDPELILPLLSLLEQCKGLSDDTLLQAAYLSHQAGALSFAYRTIRHRAVPYLLTYHRRHDWLLPDFMQLLIALQPSTALQILRRTRARGVRRDEDETIPQRREHLAQAYEALGRYARAKRLRKK